MPEFDEVRATRPAGPADLDVRRAEWVQGRAFLAQAGAVLASSLDYEDTLASVAHLLVPQLADWCVIYLAEDDGIRRVGLAHADPAKYETLRQIHERYDPVAHESSPVWLVLRTGQSLMSNEVPDQVLRDGSVDDEQFRLLRDLVGVRAGMVVPMLCRERALGAICLIMSDSGRRYDENHLALAQELARIAALAVDNARLYREAQRAIHMRDEFMSVASHELRTPLNTLLLGLQLARRQAGTAPGTLGSLLQRCELQTRRLASLLDQLLDVSRLSAGILALQREQCDLAEVARDVAGRFEAQAAEAGCALTLRAEAPVTGAWDRLRLEQVVTNLLSNAIKYGNRQPIEVAVLPAGPLARLCVTDRGIGVPEEEQARIFERFHRATTEHRHGSLGLGLYIVKSIVDAHGGSIVLSSKPGNGASFTVDLPRYPSIPGRWRAGPV